MADRTCYNPTLKRLVCEDTRVNNIYGLLTLVLYHVVAFSVVALHTFIYESLVLLISSLMQRIRHFRHVLLLLLLVVVVVLLLLYFKVTASYCFQLLCIHLYLLISTLFEIL